MLFNSYLFIFIYLPIFLIIWQFIGISQPKRLPAYLLLASIVFYAFWDISWVILLLCLASGNYFIGLALASQPETGAQKHARRIILAGGLLFNLLPLTWFKYSGFIIENLALLFHADWKFLAPIFPLGISFYTFIQIAWLIGIYRGETRPPYYNSHLLFSFCFPYIISGPIVRQGQMDWQFERLQTIKSYNVAQGLTLFIFGLAKKAILADSLGFYANSVFNAAAKGWPLTSLEAWLGSLCYSFQLYFDFSGYTDMAIGLGLMIGLKLPENFNSPYKATGIIEFWRRWHMTLSAWLKDFLYIPLGGNRHGQIRQYGNLFMTMLLGGIWHGAGWTFVIWGAMHGSMLCVNHIFRCRIRNTGIATRLQYLPWRLFFICLTFLFLNLSWVIFRAPSLNAGLAIYEAMFSGPFISLSPAAGGGAEAIADIFNLLLPNHYFSGWFPVFLLLASFGICWFLPNSQQILAAKAGFLSWRLTPAWSSTMALLSFLALAMLTRQSSFLYFQF